MGYPPQPMTESAAAHWPTTIDTVYRAESRRVLATLIRLLGDFDSEIEIRQGCTKAPN